jgi:hypothetical protein
MLENSQCKEVSADVALESSDLQKEDTSTNQDKMGSKASLKSKDNDQTSTRGLGSRVSLKSHKEEDESKSVKENEDNPNEVKMGSDEEEEKNTDAVKDDDNLKKKDKAGSKVSLRSDTLGSKASLHSKENDISNGELTGSTASLKIKEEKPEAMGSKVSVRSRNNSKADISGSKLSLKSKEGDDIKQENMGSKVSMKSQREVNMGSKVSLKSRRESNMGSKISLKSKSESNAIAETETTEELANDLDEETLKAVKPTPRARKDSKMSRQLSKL